jgi:hypothetical protein
MAPLPIAAMPHARGLCQSDLAASLPRARVPGSDTARRRPLAAACAGHVSAGSRGIGAGGHRAHYALAVPPVGRCSQGRRLVGGNVRVRASRVAVIVDGERAEAAACACRPGVEPHRRR